MYLFSSYFLLFFILCYFLFTFAPSFSYPLAYFHYPPFLTLVIILHPTQLLLSSTLHYFIILYSSHILLSSTPHTFYYPPFLPSLLSSTPHTFYYPPFLPSLLSSTPHTFYYPPLFTHFVIFYSSHILSSTTPHIFYYSPFLTPFIILHSTHLLLPSIFHIFYYPSLLTSFIIFHSSQILLHLFLIGLLSSLLLPLITFSPSISVANALYVQFFYPFGSPYLLLFPLFLLNPTHSMPSSLPLFFHDVKNNR